MISGEFYLENYANWHVAYFMLTDIEDAEEIIDELHELKCSLRFIRKAEKLLYSGNRNIGITYSNSNYERTVIVVSKTTDIFEFLNSFSHEIDHVEKHISKALRFSPYSEDASYLVGEIIFEMAHDVVNNYLKYVRHHRIRRTR